MSFKTNKYDIPNLRKKLNLMVLFPAAEKLFLRENDAFKDANTPQEIYLNFEQTPEAIPRTWCSVQSGNRINTLSSLNGVIFEKNALYLNEIQVLEHINTPVKKYVTKGSNFLKVCQ